MLQSLFCIVLMESVPARVNTSSRTPKMKRSDATLRVNEGGRWIGATILCGRPGFCKQDVAAHNIFTHLMYIHVLCPRKGDTPHPVVSFQWRLEFHAFQMPITALLRILKLIPES